MLKIWTVLALCAALAGAGTWLALDHAYAQSAPAVTVSPDGAVTGVPQVTPEGAIDWLADTFRAAREHARAKEWGPLVALILTALCSAFALLLRLVPAVWAWVQPRMGYAGVALTLAMYLAADVDGIPVGSGPVPWLKAIGTAVTLGMAACGGWELVLKPLLRRFAPGLASKLAAPIEAPKP